MAESNFNQAAEQRQQLDSLASCFNNPASFPDVTMTCDGKKWRCHRMVLGMRSETFRRMFSNNFMEAGQSEIPLLGCDPFALEAALEYCYTLKVRCHDLAQDGKMSLALFHVHLFEIGETRFIRGLAGLAADGFKRAIDSDDITPEQLAEAIRAAYAVSDPTRLLRDPIINRVLNNKETLLSGSMRCFNELVSGGSDFGYEMIRALRAHTGSANIPLARLQVLAGDPTGRRVAIGLVAMDNPVGGNTNSPPVLVVTVGVDAQGRINYRVRATDLTGHTVLGGASRANSISWTGLLARRLQLLGRFTCATEAEVRTFATNLDASVRSGGNTDADRLPLAERSPSRNSNGQGRRSTAY
ncbi:uncharacterized protein RCC_09968 [Ramularia collo-cygni]|uniref:BTB domain-containing protein n=1 Tax=Ramularia collo-cygni TaxID=112498 RepID=A0A2D3VL42_9PEZI|nr:uncharacterized protein RCC_09968 [Ramularia collo-cygni]CZT24249.1 uncharacterized protein RCC_09968 [Ramularia collo-cygni]